MPRHFWRTVVVFRRYRPPSSVKKTGSSSRELGSPPEFVVPASARLTGRLPWGLPPLRDISPASPLPTSIPGPPMFRPQRFTRSRRLAPRRTLQTCFILLPRPGFSLQGVPPPTRPVPPRRWPLPSRRWRRLLPPVTRRRRRASRRPQGLLQAGIRSASESVTPRSRPCPLMRFCSFGLASPVLKAR